MNHLTIQTATCDDAARLAALNREELGYDYPVQEVENILEKLLKSDSERIYVALINEEMVGYVHASDYETLYAGPMKNVMGIVVDHRYRKRGIATMLMKKVEAWAESSGADGIRLVSGAQRKHAHAFYRAYGFHEDKKQLNFKFLF